MQSGDMKGVTCPSVDGNREDLPWGHHFLLNLRWSVQEASPVE